MSDDAWAEYDAWEARRVRFLAQPPRSGARYLHYVEYGTHRSRSAPFLRSRLDSILDPALASLYDPESPDEDPR